MSLSLHKSKDTIRRWTYNEKSNKYDLCSTWISVHKNETCFFFNNSL